MPNDPTTRRDFLRTAAALTAGTATPYWYTSPNAQASEPAAKADRPHIGAVGVGNQGSTILQEAAAFGNVVAVCDVDRLYAERAKAAYGGKPDIYGDYRELLQRSDIDVIINGTPDHWHTAVNIAACKAGKDVYTEKPLTLTIDEGKILRDVVGQTGRIVQVGTQQRSGANFQLAVEMVRNGRIGKLKQVWVALPHFSTKAGPFPTEPVPDHLNWEMYQGQAPVHNYCVPRTHLNFRWWYEYAGGIITDWGNHHLDIAHWGMDCELTGPTSIDARGLFPNEGEPDCFNTADRFFSRMIYPNGVEILYFTSLANRSLYGGVVKEHAETTPDEIDFLFGDDCPDEVKALKRHGVMFIGDAGRIFINRGGIHGKPVEELKENPLPDDRWRVHPSNHHMGNFFDCVKTREEPVSPVRVQHRTVSACHLTNISLRLGRKIAFDPKAEQITGDAEANGWLKRAQREPYGIEA